MSTVQFRSQEIGYDPVRLERVLWALVAFAFIGDVITTMVGLRLGLMESNGIVASSVDAYGVPGIVAIKTTAVLIGLVCRRLLDAEHRWTIPACLSVPWLAATANNLYLIMVITT